MAEAENKDEQLVAADNTSNETTSAAAPHEGQHKYDPSNPFVEKGESIFYAQRSKMFRFDDSVKEWKERGVGLITLQRNIETGRIRLLMRRDQTRKVAANHDVSPGLELTATISSEKTWSYKVPMDYSDEEPGPAVFAVRFGTVDHAKEFKNKFVEAQNINKSLQKEVEVETLAKEKAEEESEVTDSEAEPNKDEPEKTDEKKPEDK